MEINKVFDAIEANDLQRLKQILRDGFDVNSGDKDGYTLLHMAVDCDNESALRVLLSTTGCRVNCCTTYHRLSGLHFAAQDGKCHLVALLLDFGADIDCVNHCNCTPLYFAVCANHVSTVRLLLDRGANPNISDTNKISPLLQAVSISQELTELLLERKAQMSEYSREIHTSLLSNKPEITDLLVDRISAPLVPNRIGRTPLQNAVQHICTDDPQQAVALIKKLIQLGEDINHCNQFGGILHILIQRNKFSTNKSEDPTSEAIFKYLVDLENCELNSCVSINGTGTPLTLAFKLNKYWFAETLIRAGADINSCDLNGFKYSKSAEPVLKLLFYCGFNFDDSFISRSRPINSEDFECFEVFRDWIRKENSKAKTLKQLIRIWFRHSYQNRLNKIVDRIQCPEYLKAFILLESGLDTETIYSSSV